MYKKLVPDSFFILVDSPKQPLHAKNSFWNMFWKGITPLRKLTLFFLSNPILFNGQNFEKQKGPRTSDQSLFRLWNKFTKISLLVTYYLTMFDGVNIKRFLSYSKNYTCKFMQANSGHRKLFHFHLSFRIWKVWKGRRKITKNWISWE